MGDENPIRTLGDYSKPSHEGYRNTIELPLDSIDLDDENRIERACVYFISFDDQASNWLDVYQQDPSQHGRSYTRFLAQFFPSGRTAKLRNDILMFQQHHGETLSEAWTRFKDLLQKVPHHGIDRWLQILFF
ncbi:zinc finger, CCHC-type containing protein [Tanacetum coccineum]